MQSPGHYKYQSLQSLTKLQKHHRVQNWQMQEPITRSVQLPYQAHLMTFLQTGLSVSFFSHEIGQFKSTWACTGKEIEDIS